MYPQRTHLSWPRLLSPEGWLVRTLQWLVCRCAGNTPPHSCLPCFCPQHSLQVKGILASLKPALTWHCFGDGFLFPASPLSPDGWLLPILVWLQDSLHLAEVLQMQKQSFGNILVPPFFLFPLLHNAERHALLLNVSKFSWMVSVPDSAVMFMLHAVDWVFPRCTQKLLHILPAMGKHTLLSQTILAHYSSFLLAYYNTSLNCMNLHLFVGN